MNNFQIFEEVGRGDNVIVYKGRRTKTIDYYALKSVSKAHKPKVQEEVRHIHALEHPNIMKFYSWYETHNHLWLVLEFCPGGNLASMIRQDIRFPEATVHMMARDLVSALHYIHSKGTIMRVISPSNILVSASGVLKLSGFSRARRIGDTRAVPSFAADQPYTSPEILAGGAASPASDLWSLGCILYEMAAGYPPFRSADASLRDPSPPPPPGSSQTFGALVSCLLSKDPAQRMGWPLLLQHTFWRPPLDLVVPSIPGVPSISVARPGSAAPPSARTTDSAAVPGGAAAAAAAVAASPASVRTPVAAAPVTPAAAALRPKTPGTATPAATPTVPLTAAVAAGSAPDSNGDGVAVSAASAMAAAGAASATAAAAGSEMSEQDDEGDDGDDETNASRAVLNTADAARMDRATAQAHMRMSKAFMSGDLASGGAAVADSTSAGELPPSIDTAKAQSELAAAGAALLFVETDLSVRPIVGNRRIERLPAPSFDARALAVRCPQPAELVAMSATAAQDVLSGVLKVLASQTSSIAAKTAGLGYLCVLANDQQSANILVNSTLVAALLRLLRSLRVVALRVKVADVVGLMLRFATFIDEKGPAAVLPAALVELMRDTNESTV